tara:strand:+ start:1816 stop:2190 length:375 start_codon:yes stop_codon:yes gene_type:complete
MTKCDCDCHKKDAQDAFDRATNELVRCKKTSHQKSTQIEVLKRKLLIATVAIAVGGTFVGKEAFDRMLEYFQKYDKVKQAIDKVTINSDHEISMPAYYGASPSPAPGTLAVFGLYLLIPKSRRK